MFNYSRKPRSRISAKAYLHLVDSLYKEGRALLMGTVFISGSILSTYWKTGEVLLLVCAVIFMVTAAARGLLSAAYAQAKPSITSVDQANFWERGYVLGAAVSVATLGLWCFVSLANTNDQFTLVVSFSMTIGYLSGVSGRNFANEKAVDLQIICAAVPMIAALLMFGNSYYWAFAGFLLPYFLGLRFIAKRLRTVLLDAILTSDEMGILAKRFNTALTNMPGGICMFGNDGKVAVTNQKLLELLKLDGHSDLRGWSAQRLLRTCVRAGLFNSSETAKLAETFRQLACMVADSSQIETKDGRTLEIEVEPMGAGGAVALVQDITERRAAENTISHMARFDMLTGLANRNELADRLGELCKRSETSEPFAVHFIDLDGFKAVNDTLGHARGDLLLKKVSERLQGLLRPSDMVARFGGDEFVIIQTPVQSPSVISGMAEHIVQQLSLPFMVEGHSIVLGTSIGIARCPIDSRDSDTLLKQADMALYHAKEIRRGTWHYFNAEIELSSQERRKLEVDLRAGIERDEFALLFQPIVNFKSNRIKTCEALVRWHHPERGVISPLDFIPVAEETGIIVELGELVLREACKECQKWPDDVRVAVNISPIQFGRSDVAVSVAQALASSGLPPHRLELEITESALLQKTESVLKALLKIRDLGVTISLDDFGTGYSSLSYLHSFPLNKVKIDRSYLADLKPNSHALILLKGISSLSTDLGLSVTAEGIEDQEILDLVQRETFVTDVQGYHFGRPMPSEEIRKMLTHDGRQLEEVA